MVDVSALSVEPTPRGSATVAGEIWPGAGKFATAILKLSAHCAQALDGPSMLATRAAPQVTPLCAPATFENFALRLEAVDIMIPIVCARSQAHSRAPSLERPDGLHSELVTRLQQHASLFDCGLEMLGWRWRGTT